MTPQEIGLLILKIQDDDVLASDVRRFLKILMTDEEVQRNARLAASLSGLSDDVRQGHCLSGILILLTAQALSPEIPPDGQWRPTTELFSEKFFICLQGPWKEHIQNGDPSLSAQDFKKRIRSLGGRKSTGMPALKVSGVLAHRLSIIEEFWGVRGTFVQ
jgi:hypothetical protein